MTIPSWLNPAKELRINEPNSNSSVVFVSQGPYPETRFILLALKNLLTIGLNPWQAIQICGNSCAETGYGVARFVGFNFGGVKINEAFVKEFKKNNSNQDPFWWQAPGHVKSGDQEVCYYRTYVSPASYFEEWIKRFIPKNGSGRYKKTGEVFWTGDEKWFLELCIAGYKGVITEANPTPSFEKHKGVVQRCITMVCQALLGCKPDASWGNKSKKKATEFITSAALNLQPEPTIELFSKLISSWKLNGFQQPIWGSLV